MITQDGKIYIFSGKSRSGKTALAALLVKSLKIKTVFAWDPEAQWCNVPGFVKVTSIQKMRDLVMAGKGGRYAYVCNGDLKEGFEQLCAVAFHWAMFKGDGESLFIAEELADVTTSAKAGPEWGKLVRRVLKRQMSIIAISQRWQEADKTAIGNASRAYIFKPVPKDAAYVAGAFGLDVASVAALEQFHYIEWKDYGKPEAKWLPWAKKPDAKGKDV
ncbi:MAG TPA: hypothetical protein VGE06_09605 [Flavisolibacter sp.]